MYNDNNLLYSKAVLLLAIIFKSTESMLTPLKLHSGNQGYF